MNAHRRSRRGAWAALMVILALAPAGSAQNVGDLDTQLIELRRQIASATDPAQRIELLSRSDDLRKRLIAASPADIRVPTWWVERAASALEVLAADGADVAVLFGIPTESQRQLARARAKDALDHSARADQAVAQAVARLEAQLVDRSTDAATRQSAELQLSTLVDVEQTRRIPFLRASARLLLATSGADRATRASAQIAARELAEIPEPSDELGLCAHRLSVGISAGHAALAEPERSGELRAAAARQLRLVIDRCSISSDAAAAVITARARLGLCRIGEDPGAAGSPAADSELHAREAEARAALLVERASAEPLARTELFTRAVVLLKGPITSGTPAAAARACQTIAAMLPSDVSIESLPAEAALARAIVRAREEHPSAQAEALKLLDQVAARTDAPPAVRSLARWERVVLAAASGDAAQELDALAAIYRAKDSPTRDERAFQAARRVVDLFAAAAAGAPSGRAEVWKSRESLLHDALDLLSTRGDADAPRFAEQLARLLISDLAAPAKPSAEKLATLRSLIERLPSKSPMRTSAGTSIVEAMLRQFQARQAALTDKAAAATPENWNELIADIARELTFARTHAPQTQPVLTLALGEAKFGTGDPEAVALLNSVIGSDIDRPLTPVWSRLRLTIAQAHRRTGDAASAVAVLREMTDKLEGAPGSATRDPAFWLAWSELLEILQLANTNGSRSPDIRVQIRRLELLDPSFGGQPGARRIQEVRAAVGTD